MITQEKLMYHLSYDRETGNFTWVVPTGDRVRKGYRAGFDNGAGYVFIRIMGKIYPAHRLAWLYCYGDMPPKGILVDHIDRNKGNNRIDNLRLATSSQNLMNQGLSKANTSGVKGVVFDKGRGKYAARIKVNQKTINLGRFETISDAKSAYEEASKKYHGDYGRIAVRDGLPE